ncbi:fasciclin domain-containing protein [Ekhidna sp.]
MRKLFALLFMPASLILASCNDDDGGGTPPVEDPNLVEAATDAGLTILLDAITAVDGLSDDLASANAITVFAPNDAAFAAALDAYGVTTLDQLVAELGGIDNLETVLGFHVVGAVAFASDLAEGDQTLTTLAGLDLTVNKSGNNVTVTDANGAISSVVTADVSIENGVVHVIDGVLLPTLELPSVVDASTGAGLTTLLDAVTAAELGTTLTSAESITVFAPTNDAFGGLLERYDAADLDELVNIIGLEAVSEVLKFHIVPAVAFSHDLEEGNQTFTTLQGQDLTVTVDAGNVTVTDYLGFSYSVSVADVAIANGVVHVIDGVVLPDLSNDPNVVEAATDAGLSTLIDAVVAANLADALIQATAITVFAPTNDAFGDLLDAQEVDDLEGLISKLGAADVAKVLQFHVVPAVAFSEDLVDGDQMFETLAGEMLLVNKTDGNVTITDAAQNTYSVTTANVTIENGVVHVINGVLLPTL